MFEQLSHSAQSLMLSTQYSSFGAAQSRIQQHVGSVGPSNPAFRRTCKAPRQVFALLGDERAHGFGLTGTSTNCSRVGPALALLPLLYRRHRLALPWVSPAGGSLAGSMLPSDWTIHTAVTRI